MVRVTMPKLLGRERDPDDVGVTIYGSTSSPPKKKPLGLAWAKNHYDARELKEGVALATADFVDYNTFRS